MATAGASTWAVQRPLPLSSSMAGTLESIEAPMKTSPVRVTIGAPMVTEPQDFGM